MTSAGLAERSQSDLLAPQSAKWILRSSSESIATAVDSGSIARTIQATQELIRAAATALPIMVATSAYVPANVVEVVQTFQAVPATFAMRHTLTSLTEADDWRYVPEQIDRAAIDELKRIWALPYRGDVDFDISTD